MSAEHLAIESYLTGLPARDDCKQAGDATYVLNQAASQGQFEARISTFVVFGYDKRAEWRQCVQPPAE